MSNEIIISLIIVISILIFLFIVMTMYYNIKINKITDNFTYQIESLNESVPELDIDDRLTYTEHLLTFIDNMIEFEVINEKRFELILGQSDKNLDIDKVLKNVSTKVYESIEKNVYTDPNNILTSKYIMEYIQKKTFIACMSYVQSSVNSQID